MKNKKRLLAVFAHPDDEAFGPSGSLIQWSTDYDISLVCVTDGARGKNPVDQKNLADIRRSELEASAAILGVSTIYFLDFEDGSLCNNNYHDLATELQKLVDLIHPETLLTFEPRGVSGHLDHIAVTSIISFIFERNRYIKRLLYHVMHADLRARLPDYFVFMPPGYNKEQIDLTININKQWDLKREAILCHTSQKTDSSHLLKHMEAVPKEEHFIVITQ
jgi:LmbE family N-acetylglucosaminyl deacetylase